MNANEIRKKVEKEREIKFNLIIFIIALILYIGIYFASYNYYKLIISLDRLDECLVYVGLVAGVLVYEIITLSRHYFYDEITKEPESIEQGVMSSYKYSTFQEKKRFIILFSIFIGGCNAYLYLLWLGYLAE